MRDHEGSDVRPVVKRLAGGRSPEIPSSGVIGVTAPSGVAIADRHFAATSGATGTAEEVLRFMRTVLRIVIKYH